MTKEKIDERARNAAPELLAMLKSLAASCNGDMLGTAKAPVWSVLCRAEAIIAAVEGRG